MEDVVNLDDEPVTVALRDRHKDREANVCAAGARGRLDVFGDVRGHSGKEHRVELLDVHSVGDGRSRNDGAKRFVQMRERLTRRDTRFGAPHDFLNLSSRYGP